MRKIAVVTGASRGIGKAVSDLLLSKGYYTIQISKSQKTEIFQESASVNFDISNTKEIPSLIRRIKEISVANNMRLEALVNCAGFSKDSLLLSADPEAIYQLLNTNLYSTILITRAILKIMLQNKSGSIVNVSSIVGPIIGNAGQTVYSATKAGLVGFTKSLAKEIGRKVQLF